MVPIRYSDLEVFFLLNTVLFLKSMCNQIVFLNIFEIGIFFLKKKDKKNCFITIQGLENVDSF